MEKFSSDTIALMNGPKGFQLVGRTVDRYDLLVIDVIREPSEAIKVLEQLGDWMIQDWYTRFEIEFMIGKILEKV
jgi:hypothetical protein